MVTLAEEFIARNRKARVTATRRREPEPIAAVAPIVRGACSLKRQARRRCLAAACSRISRKPDGLEFLAVRLVFPASQAASLHLTTPSALKTGRWSCHTPIKASSTISPARAEKRSMLSSKIIAIISNATTSASAVASGELDPLPRIVLVPGLGLFGLGRTKQDAVIAADIAEQWMVGVADAEAIGKFESISEAEMFDVEYWPLEQAKLGARKEPPLAGQIAAITGAAGAIGAATAKAFRAAGAEVALLDVNLAAARETATSDRPDGACPRMRRDRRGLGGRSIRQDRGTFRRCRHRGVECRRGLAGTHRRSRREDFARKLRVEFLRPPARRAGGGQDHAGAEDRRLSPVQRLQAGGQSRAGFRALRRAEGGVARLDAPICARLRRRRHPRQRRQRRPHPFRLVDRGLHQGARQGARRDRRRSI